LPKPSLGSRENVRPQLGAVPRGAEEAGPHKEESTMKKKRDKRQKLDRPIPKEALERFKFTLVGSQKQIPKHVKLFLLSQVEFLIDEEVLEMDNLYRCESNAMVSRPNRGIMLVDLSLLFALGFDEVIEAKDLDDWKKADAWAKKAPPYLVIDDKGVTDIMAW
jgi:hypothetical protein